MDFHRKNKKCIFLPILVLFLFQIGSKRPALVQNNDEASLQQHKHDLLLLSNNNDDGKSTRSSRGETTTTITTRRNGEESRNITATTTTAIITATHERQTKTLFRQQSISTITTRRTPKSTLLCSNDQILQGRWVPVTLDRPPYMPLSPRVRCLRPDAFSEPISTYEWKPFQDATTSGCQIVPLTRDSFCHVLSNQTVAFIGDSLTLEHYASLIHMLGDGARLPPKAVKHGRIHRRICSTSSNSSVESLSAGNHNNKNHNHKNNDDGNCVDLVFKTDFFLENITAEVDLYDQQQSMPPLPRVMVLNRGAHYKPDDELITSLQEQTLPSLRRWNQKCRQQLSSCLLVWRTSVPGHPQCQTFTQPSTSVSEMETWIYERSTNHSTGPYRKGEYHWQDFQRQNGLVKRLLVHQWQSILTHVKIIIMDSYQPNILRPDNHRSHMGDCLHTCSPGGGSDLNSQWLFHLIILQMQMQTNNNNNPEVQNHQNKFNDSGHFSW